MKSRTVIVTFEAETVLPIRDIKRLVKSRLALSTMKLVEQPRVNVIRPTKRAKPDSGGTQG